MFHLIINGFVLGFLSSPTCPSNAEEVRWGTARIEPAWQLAGRVHESQCSAQPPLHLVDGAVAVGKRPPGPGQDSLRAGVPSPVSAL
jgi:hypothetical protein